VCKWSYDFWRHCEAVDLLNGSGSTVGLFPIKPDATRVALLFQLNTSINSVSLALGNKPGAAVLWALNAGGNNLIQAVYMHQVGNLFLGALSATFTSIDPDAKLFTVRYNPSNP